MVSDEIRFQRCTDYSKLAGSFNLGYVDASYSTLEKIFGKPCQVFKERNQTDVEWHLEFEDGTFASIYNRIGGRWTNRAAVCSPNRNALALVKAYIAELG